eukprot:CAMPEP_0168539556 /NCGR_PEP_ID=MMETSP0405-20121227/21903_1 /TAXON_ID=498012 /ORGANISM="Trichosphaerium sp, Strain Am-I-7 wt" /LENGTH=323 /DNA_ID=CAMNT_0008569151 /DNA_START=38 /DNA_END=1009 /DNA_ORIENTATION=-
MDHTPHSKTICPVDMQGKKSVMGGKIHIRAQMKKNFFTPWEDIEVLVDLQNDSSRKVKELEFKLISKQKSANMSSKLVSDFDTVLEWHKKLYPKKLYPGDKATQQFIMELPKTLTHTFVKKNVFGLDYFLRISVDIPKLPDRLDLFIDVPVDIVIRDPHIPKPPLPMLELAALPHKLWEWTPRHILAWLCYKLNMPEFRPSFIFWDLNGDQLFHLSDSSMATLVEGHPGATEKLTTILKTRIEEIMYVRRMLWDLHLGHCVTPFEAHGITKSTLVNLTKTDLHKVVKVGECYKILEYLDKEFPNRKSNAGTDVSTALRTLLSN